MIIKGSTRFYGCIGDPIRQVKAPTVYSNLLKEKNIDSLMIPIHASPKCLKNVIDGLKSMENFDGLIVTMPHKEEVLKYCDIINPTAKIIGAVNSIYFNSDRILIGDNFDGLGFTTSLIDYNYKILNKSIVMFGAGGAARSIAFALAEFGVGSLFIINRTIHKSKSLAEKLSKLYPNQKFSYNDSPQINLKKADVVINATSLGLNKEDPLPFNPEETNENCIIAEINAMPETTALLIRALNIGRSVHYGAKMVEYQITMHSEFLRMW